jgi:hypothetical protein
MNAVRLFSDGTDGTGGGETKEYFLELFTELSVAAGARLPASLLDACAAAVDDYVEDMAEFMDDEDGYRRRCLEELTEADAKQGRHRLTVIAGGKRS